MNPITKWSIAVGAVLLVPTVAHAQADEKAACDEPYDAWQVASKERHFLEAREKLKLCARASCGENMAADCTKELAKLEDRIPAIIMRAEELGQPLDAAVQLDGKPLVDHPRRSKRGHRPRLSRLHVPPRRRSKDRLVDHRVRVRQDAKGESRLRTTARPSGNSSRRSGNAAVITALFASHGWMGSRWRRCRGPSPRCHLRRQGEPRQRQRQLR